MHVVCTDGSGGLGQQSQQARSQVAPRGGFLMFSLPFLIHIHILGAVARAPSPAGSQQREEIWR